MPTQTIEEKQHTLSGPVTVEGYGLFSGVRAKATIRPAPVGAGISFRRTDLPGSKPIPARIENILDRPRRTALAKGDASVEMVEHCLSAFIGMGVDNAIVEVDAPELPAGDGSAKPFTDAFVQAGIVAQDGDRQYLTVREPITIRDGDAMITALPPNPGEATEYVYVLDFGGTSPITRQTYAFTPGRDSYEERIAPARTFSTRADAEAMWQSGMFKHLSPREMLVIGESGPIENAYRFPDEPVRHKLLDLVGDLALVGKRINGRIVALRSGHTLNQRLASRLLEAEKQIEHAAAPAMDIRSILRHLPHRYPMILVDRVLEIEGDRRAVGVKNVSINEPFFQGHYPAAPIMPGVLIVEAMCQLAGLMLSQKLERTGKIAMLLSLDGVKLRRAVTPGDQLIIETESVRASSKFGDVVCRAYVAGELAAEARVKFLMVDAEQHL